MRVPSELVVSIKWRIACSALPTVPDLPGHVSHRDYQAPIASISSLVLISEADFHAVNQHGALFMN